MAQVIKLAYQCERCAHEWLPREPGQAPITCPKCKSPYWDKPRQDSINPENRVTSKWQAHELDAKTVEYKVLRNGKPDDGVGYFSTNDLKNGEMLISIIPADGGKKLKLTQVEADCIRTHPGKYRFSCFSRS
jgi:DNA-directed RNA polymerase subunit RPC12/RpoP